MRGSPVTAFNRCAQLPKSVNVYRCLTGIRRVTIMIDMTIMLQTTPPNPAALTRRPDTAGPLAVATPTTRRLADVLPPGQVCANEAASVL